MAQSKFRLVAVIKESFTAYKSHTVDLAFRQLQRLLMHLDPNLHKSLAPITYPKIKLNSLSQLLALGNFIINDGLCLKLQPSNSLRQEAEV